MKTKRYKESHRDTVLFETKNLVMIQFTSLQLKVACWLLGNAIPVQFFPFLTCSLKPLHVCFPVLLLSTVITNADLRHKPIAGSKPLPGRDGSRSWVGDFHVHNCVKVPIQRGPETMNLTINSPPFIWFAANGIGSGSSCIQQLLTTNKGQS
jgi:hypothetical protein